MCSCGLVFFVFKQKTAYEMRISDWSSDVCSSDLIATADSIDVREALVKELIFSAGLPFVVALLGSLMLLWIGITHGLAPLERIRDLLARRHPGDDSPLPQVKAPIELHPLLHTIEQLLERLQAAIVRSEEHPSVIQALMRISHTVYCHK